MYVGICPCAEISVCASIHVGICPVRFYESAVLSVRNYRVRFSHVRLCPVTTIKYALSTESQCISRMLDSYDQLAQNLCSTAQN